MASVTTNAADDFEFHHPSRPSMPPPQRPLPIPNKDFNPSTYVVPKSQPLPSLPPPQTQFNLRSIKSIEKEKARLQQNQHVYEEFDSRSSRQSQKITRSQVMAGSLNQPTSLSMNDLDLIDDHDDRSTIQSSVVCHGTGTTEPYEHKQRMYRKRTRLHPVGRPMNMNDRRCQQKSSNQFSDRRVLSMECLSPSDNQQTDFRNFVDISYLDTGEILFRKADSSKCVFVTDFI